MPRKDKETDKPRPNPVRVPVRISAKAPSSSKSKTAADDKVEEPVPNTTDSTPPSTSAPAPVPPPLAAIAPIPVLPKEEKSEESAPPPPSEVAAATATAPVPPADVPAPPPPPPSSALAATAPIAKPSAVVPPPAPASAPAPTGPRTPVVAPLRPPGSEGAAASEGPSNLGNRTPLLSSIPDGEPAASPAPVNYMLQKPRPPRHRKSRRFGALVALLMGTNLFVLAAGGLWLLNYVLSEMDSRISDAGLRSSQAAAMGVPGPHSSGTRSSVDVNALDVRLKDTEKQLGELRQLEAETSQILTHLAKPASTPPTPAPALELHEPKPEPVAPAANELKKEVAQNQKQVQDLQKRLTDIEGQLKDTTFRLKDLIVAMSAASAQKQPAAPALPESSIPGGVAISEPAVGSAPLSPSESELILLKERNRLTSYADEAIATAARAPITSLWESLSDPRLRHLVNGVEAEILRVRNFYLTGSRLTRYEIPIAELFPETPAGKRDTDLKDDQLLTLLNDTKQPWQTRMKTAWLLGRRPKTPAIVEALLHSVKEDPNLDVVKESTFSFQRLTGFETRLFEPTALMEAWWKEYGQAPGAGTPETKRAIVPETAPASPPASTAPTATEPAMKDKAPQ